MDSESIQATIRRGLPDADVAVTTDDGVHFHARVVSPSFVGKASLARHRMVYATLGSDMGDAIHALGLETLTPDEAGA